MARICRSSQPQTRESATQEPGKLFMLLHTRHSRSLSLSLSFGSYLSIPPAPGGQGRGGKRRHLKPDFRLPPSPPSPVAKKQHLVEVTPHVGVAWTVSPPLRVTPKVQQTTQLPSPNRHAKEPTTRGYLMHNPIVHSPPGGVARLSQTPKHRRLKSSAPRIVMSSCPFSQPHKT